MESYLTTNLILALSGIFFAAIGYFCAIKHANNPKDTLFPGTRIPMAIIGIFGYDFIAVTAVLGLIGGNRLEIYLHQGLIIFSGIFTLYLIYKAIKIRLFCLGCIVCWGISIALVVITYLFVT